MIARAQQEPFGDYRAASGVNFSRLKRMEWSPAHYMCEVEREDTPDLALGRLLHLSVLEPSLYQALVLDSDDWPGGMTKGPKPRPTTNKQSDAYKEWAAARRAEGRILSTRSDMDLHQRVHDAVRSHPVAAMYLSWPGQAEVSIYWQHPLELKCKSRIDWLGDRAILDLKSTRDIRPHDFARSAYRYRYHAQAAYYQDAVKALTGERRPYLIVAVEKTPPFDVVVTEVPDDALAAGRAMYQDWMLRVLECQETGEWPGVSLEQTVLELPPYAFSDMDDAALIVGGKEIRL